MELEGDEENIALAWNKTERDLKTAGLRDGLSDGKDSTFQSSFDSGYQDGFRTGFAMGKYVAALQFSKTKDADKTEPLLSKAEQGWCQMCPDPSESPSLSEASNKQLETVNHNLQTLNSLYSEKVEVSLPVSLDRIANAD